MESLYGNQQLNYLYRKLFLADDEALIGAFLSTVITALVYQDIEHKTDFADRLGVMPEIEFSDENPYALGVKSGLVQVGMRILQQFDDYALVFCDYLLSNFQHQMAPPGDAPSLDEYGSPDEVCNAALKIYTAGRMPGNTANDGYVKSQANAFMEVLAHYQFESGSDSNQSIGASGMLYKPQLPLDHYFEDQRFDLLPKWLEDDVLAPYYLRLHQQLLLDTLFFILAHELAHLALKHTEYMPTNEQSRQDEVAADETALEAMQSIADFNLRSLLMPFWYVHSMQQKMLGSEYSETLDSTHPLSSDRISLLTAAAVRLHDNEGILTDINASLALLASPRYETIACFMGEQDEETELRVRYLPSIDYSARLEILLTRRRQNTSDAEIMAESAAMLHSVTFKLHLVLRSQVHPGTIHRRATVPVRAGISDPMPFLSNRPDGTVEVRFPLTFMLLPEWWLNYPQSVVDIEKIETSPDPIDEPLGNTKPVIDYRQIQAQFDHLGFLSSKQDNIHDRETGRMILLTARQYDYVNLFQEAIPYFRWIYDHQRYRLRYPDWLSLCSCLNQAEQWSAVEQVVTDAIQACEGMRPGFNLQYAWSSLKQGKYNRALKHVYLEIVGIGEFGEYYQKASELYNRVIELDELEGGEELLIFHEQAIEAKQYVETGEIDEAIEQWQMARDILEEADRLEKKEDSVLWQQYHAEAGASIVRLSDESINASVTEYKKLEKTTKAEFDSILSEYPSFVPPLIELSKLALHVGDREEARRLWKQAYEMMPLHHSVYDLRYEVEL